MTRDYDNSKREKRATKTATRILVSAEELVREKPLADVTLNEVAARADVSVQTVIRKYGGWDGLLLALADRVSTRIEAQRKTVQPGDVTGAVDNVIEHYEAEGDLILRLLSQEATSDFAADAAKQGRAFHRDWVESVFAPLLSDADRERQVDVLVVATDLYTWRLLRRDLKRELDDVRDVMLRLVRTTLGDPS